jgi:hypothetical protein
LAELTDKQYQVNTEQALNLRLRGDGSAAVVASLKPKTIVHVTGPANAAGYAEGYAFGWLGKDHKTLYSDSLGVAESSIDAVLLDMDCFEATGVPDVYGRQPGVVRGWVYLEYLVEVGA